MSRSSKAHRASNAANVAARSAQSSGRIKCYVEAFVDSSGRTNLRLREKRSRRTVRVITRRPEFEHMAPLANLLQDCRAHGGGLVEPRSSKEYIAIAAPIVTQSDETVSVSFDRGFSVQVTIVTLGLEAPPVSVWCYIEEYEGEDGALGVRLRQKATGRKVEMYGDSAEHLARFLASPRFTGAHAVMPNLYEKDGYRDYVMVSGGTAVDSYDVLLYERDAQLTYLLGPSPDTAYRDAFRAVRDESAAGAHSRTAQSHFDTGRYREAVLAARLAVEMACGGSGQDVKRAMAKAPQNVQSAGVELFAQRNVAVHEGGTRVEQSAALRALSAMAAIIDFVETTSHQTTP